MSTCCWGCSFACWNLLVCLQYHKWAYNHFLCSAWKEEERKVIKRDPFLEHHMTHFPLFSTTASLLLRQLQQYSCRGGAQLYSAQALTNLTWTVFVFFSGAVFLWLTCLHFLWAPSAEHRFVQVAPVSRSSLRLNVGLRFSAHIRMGNCTQT